MNDEPPAEPRNLAALQIGEMVGRYRISAVIGQGGFAITYRADDSQLHREVAIKEHLPITLVLRQGPRAVVPRSTSANSDFAVGLSRFADEGRTLARLHHVPAIVRVFDFVEANGTAYLVMELVQGETMASRLESVRKFSQNDVEQILWPLLEGLERVHDVGFLHRDIKPANILLNANGDPTLIDFGSARLANSATPPTAIFTPGYAAAEQFTSAKPGPYTDIYGLSATIYHSIAGKKPPGAIDRMVDDKYQPLTKLAPPGFSHELLAGIDAGLVVRAAKRPQTISSWRRLLAPSGSTTAPTVALGKQQFAIGGSRAPSWSLSKSHLGIYGVAAVAAAALAVGTYSISSLQSARNVVIQDVQTEVRETATEARLKAEIEAAQKRFADEAEARKQAEAELQRSEAQRRQLQDDEAKRRAEAESVERRRVEAEVLERDRLASDQAAAKRRAEEDIKAAEMTEAALRLSVQDRRRIQIGLTALGFDTRGSDGVFGLRSREMIAAWQRRNSQPATGFLTGPQHQALASEATPVIAKLEEEQKMADEARRKAEEEAKARIVTSSAVSTAASIDGQWSGTLHCSGDRPVSLSGSVSDGQGILHSTNSDLSLRITASSGRVSVSVNPGSVIASGEFHGELRGRSFMAQGKFIRLSGQADACAINLVKR
jgi:serine/threonine protein kinase